MHVEHFGASFADSWGPAVYLSEWWLRGHWGRAFEFEVFEPEGFPTEDLAHPNHAGQVVVVLRKRPGALSPSDLEAPSDDSRELPAALASRDLVYRELAATTKHLTDQIRTLTAH